MKTTVNENDNRALSDAELVAQLEQLSGRQIRTQRDITAYIGELSQKAGEKRSKGQQLKNLLLAGLLVVAAGQYYFIDVQLEILSQPTLTVFLPVKGDTPQRPYLGG